SSVNPDAAGFDVPFLVGRARRHGLEGRLRKSLHGKKLFDVGAEYSWKVAQAVEQHGAKLVQEGILTQDFHDQALGYAKKGRQLIGFEGYRPDEVAQALHRKGFSISGWQLGTMHEAMGLGKIDAHEV